MRKSTPRATPNSVNGLIPPLESGDRLTRTEFERRYEAMPHLKKAELIEGVVHVPAPIRFRRHANPNHHVATWLGVYEAAKPGVTGASNATARLDLDNEPQPDSLLLIDPACGGQARISADDFIEAAPELVAEIAASSVSFDLGTKLHVYRRSGVLEYIVWRVLEKKIDWFRLREGRYDRLLADPAGLLRSEAFPGLWLPGTSHCPVTRIRLRVPILRVAPGRPRRHGLLAPSSLQRKAGRNS